MEIVGYYPFINLFIPPPLPNFAFNNTKKRKAMAKNPFKVGDRVYVYPIGWGTVNLASIDTCEIDFDGDDTKTGDWRVASFTEYDPLKGGLSHERPEEKKRPTVDTSKFFETNDVDWEMLRRNTLNRLADNLKRIDKLTEEEASKELKANEDTITAETAERNLKTLKYIKKLLKEDYNVVDDFISVEELGDEVQVSLTFRKG